MTFNLFNKLILWFKKIFHIHTKVAVKRTVEVTPQPEDKSIKDAPSKEKTTEVSQDEKKPEDIPLPEKKRTEITPLPEHKPPETPSEKDPQETSKEEILTTEPSSQESDAFPAIEIETEPQIKHSTEEVNTEEKNIQIEEKDTLKPPKPYIKKPPTKEKEGKPIKPPVAERKPSNPKQKKTINLGNTQRRQRSSTRTQREPTSDENVKRETAEKVPEEKEFVTTVESPYVEINLDNTEVYMILPKQQFKTNAVKEILQQVIYTFNLNGKQLKIPVKITTYRDGYLFVEEKRIPLEEPLVKFQVAFPDEIQGGEYNYNHNDKGLYTFVAIGNNRGRMFYLYNEDGDVNPLPKRVVWVLLHEEFELVDRS